MVILCSYNVAATSKFNNNVTKTILNYCDKLLLASLYSVHAHHNSMRHFYETKFSKSNEIIFLRILLMLFSFYFLQFSFIHYNWSSLFQPSTRKLMF